jgi:hypothetical protein
MSLSLQVGCWILAASVAAGCNPAVRSVDQDEATSTAHYGRLRAQAADRLRNADDPDAVAAAALLELRDDAAAALVLIARAAALHPDDPGIGWLHAAICAEAADCDPAPLEARFRTLDPDNGLGWVNAIDRAYEANDLPALEISLSQAAALPTVNTRYTALMARFSEAVVRQANLPGDAAVLIIAGELAGPALPRLVGISRACDAGRLAAPSRLEACRTVARSMMAGDTVLVEMIGTAIAKRAWSEDSVEWKSAAEARRIYAYRAARLRQVEVNPTEGPREARNYIDLLRKHPREQDLIIAQLVDRGIDPMPPPDWKEPPPP